MRPILKFLLVVATLAFSGHGAAGEVVRAMFTIGVDNREPVIQVDSIDSGSYRSITFYSELQDLTGHNITHQWTFAGEVMFEKTFEVKGPRWRVWTSKTLVPSWTGAWTVNVLDDDRSVLASKSFEYQ